MATRKNSVCLRYVAYLASNGFSYKTRTAVDIMCISSQPSPPAPPPPPPKKKKRRSERHIVFRRLSNRFSKGLCLEGLTRLLLKSKDSKSSVNTWQRVAHDNVYFKASQSILATVFSITCLFACEEVLHQSSLVFGFGSPVFGLRSLGL